MDINCDHIYHGPVIYITSKYWLPLLNFASRISWQQSRQPVKLPHPKPRSARTCASSVIEEFEVGEKQILNTPEIEMPGTSQVMESLSRQVLPDPKVVHGKEDRQATQLCHKQWWSDFHNWDDIKCEKDICVGNHGQEVLSCVVHLLANTVVNERELIHLVYFWNKPKCMLPVLSPPGYILCLSYCVCNHAAIQTFTRQMA
jgi:hypothetical protein